jgi:ABC-type sulfate transport system substrate-binding protein
MMYAAHHVALVLKAHGFTDEETNKVIRGLQMDISQLATRQDLAELKAEITTTMKSQFIATITIFMTFNSLMVGICAFLIRR